MATSPGQSQRLATKRGEVWLRSGAAPGELAAWGMDPGIGLFPSYRSLLTSRQSLTEAAAEPGAHICLALAGGERIVGFCLQRPPRPGERWAELRPPVMQEVMGEVARGWRGLGLIEALLSLVVLRPANDERILYIMGYSWHWDLDHSRKSLQQYRDTIIHLLTPLGFRQFPTNEPNICLRSENLFMARIGAQVPRRVIKAFHNLLFGMEPD
ncbi:MAG: hypothetical protein C4525_13670 [Desulfarculus sp.]|nr:MAG: hypothetical protein C4525_13670 [Desulfarculus sp.]